MDALKNEDIYTVDTIYALPDGERAELVDGKIYYMAPPNTKHQRLVHFFDREIGNFIQSRKGECEENIAAGIYEDFALKVPSQMDN